MPGDSPKRRSVTAQKNAVRNYTAVKISKLATVVVVVMCVSVKLPRKISGPG
jgi:hypothetical protein